MTHHEKTDIPDLRRRTLQNLIDANKNLAEANLILARTNKVLAANSLFLTALALGITPTNTIKPKTISFPAHFCQS